MLAPPGYDSIMNQLNPKKYKYMRDVTTGSVAFPLIKCD